MDTSRINIKTVLFYSALTLGLALVSVYADLAGHGSAFNASNALVESGTGFNGRFFFSSGLLSFGILGSLFYAGMVRYQKALCTIMGLLGIGAIALYTQCSLVSFGSYSAALGAFGIGFTYGWFEAYFLLLLFYMVGYRRFMGVLLVSFLVKCFVTRLVGSLSFTVQEVSLYASVFLMVFSALVVVHLARSFGMKEDTYKSFAVLGTLGRRSIYVILFAISAFESVVRGLSTLGFWGEGNVINSDHLLYFFIMMALFSVVFYALYVVVGEHQPGVMLGIGFLILMGSLVSVEILSGISPFSSMVAIDFCAELTELLAHSFWLVVIVFVVRETQDHPIRVIGLAEVVLSSVAVLLSVPLLSLEGFNRILIMIALYALMVVGMLVFYFARKQEYDAEACDLASESEDRIALLSQLYGLSPREHEVFALLAVGRTRKVIQEELFISESTVKTHIQNVYQKLGVHSKQELISLVREG